MSTQTALADASEGDVLHYQVLRQGAELDVRQQVEVPVTRYSVGNALLDNPDALEADPMLIKRLRRMRASRQRARTSRRLGINV